MTDQTDCSLSVVVFAFNEADNIGPVLGELRAWLSAHEPASQIVFVDDGSTDETSEAARAALAGFPAKFVRHERNRGIGAALKSAVRIADGPWVTFLPADGQIEPAAIGTLRDAAADEQADLVLSVYDHRNDGLHRKLFSAGLRALILVLQGVRLSCEGPYLFRRALFVPDDLPPDTFFLNFEFPIRSLAAGHRVRHVTIRCRPRRTGVSKSTGWKRIAGVAYDLVDLRARRTREALARLRT